MKKILLLIALLLPASLSWATSGDAVSTFGDQNSSNVYRVVADNNGVVTFAQDTGIKYPYTTGSTNQTLTAAQTGTTIIFNNGSGVATNGTTFTLPTAVVGMKYTVVADIAKWFYLTPQSTDTINFLASAQGYRMNNSSTKAAGDSITVLCATANTWSIVDKNGTWATGPTN